MLKKTKEFRVLVWLIRLLLLHQIKIQACDYQNDDCSYKGNSRCDDDTGSGFCDVGTDCFDCDKCRQYDLDCGACLEDGCVYCPKDGLCASESIPQDYFLDTHPFDVKAPACSSQDYQSGSCVAGADNVFNDPLYTEQSWVYDLIDVQPVWRRGITGKDVHIRINDNGVNGNHPELSARFDMDGSCEINMPHDMTVTHGTTCAAIAAGEANNNECSAGIAPGATVSSCAILGQTITPEVEDGFSFLAHGIEYVDISSNSYGLDACGNNDRNPFQPRDRMLQDGCPFPAASSPCLDCTDGMLALTTAPNGECINSINIFCFFKYEGNEDPCQDYIDFFVECHYNMLAPGQRTAIERAIREGRAGKGMIYTFASGNENRNGEDANMEGFMHSRYTISVAAVGRNGLHASYSTPGAPNFISAPGGDFEFIHNHVVASAAGGCYDAGVGTSFATPVVSGVIALMLEVNSKLGWRDVQAILALSARQTDPDDESWVTNGAGLRHSNKYGFGIVNASSAVTMAKTWVNYPPEIELTAKSGVIDLVIPDDPDKTVESTLTIEQGQAGFTVESVVVFIGYQHVKRGNLKIVLTSPSGTVSALHPSKRDEITILPEDTKWELMTVSNWGESPVGDWTLSITDERLDAGDMSIGVLKTWDIAIYGKYPRAPTIKSTKALTIKTTKAPTIKSTNSPITLKVRRRELSYDSEVGSTTLDFRNQQASDDEE